MHRFLASLLLTATALVAPGVAHAAAGLPRDAQLVAGPTASGLRLYAWVRGDTLCTAARGPVDEPGDDEDTDNCPIRYALTPLGHDRLGPLADEDQRFAYGIAGADVAAVALARGDKVLAKAPTVTGSGSLAGLRFFLVDTRGELADQLRILDAAGTVRRAEDLTPFFPGFGAFELPPGARTVLRGQRDGTRWRVLAYPHSRLAPTPLEPTRRVTRSCVRLVLTRFNGPGDACEDELADRRLLVKPWSGCGRLGAAAAVLAPWRMRRLVAVRTDGRRVAGVVVHPAGTPATVMAGAVLVGEAIGIRRVEAYDGTGRLVVSEQVGQPPFNGDCFGGFSDLVLRIPSHEGERAPAGELVLADDPDGDLCADVGAFVISRLPCAPPPLEPRDVRLQTRVAGDRRVVFGVVPTDVATVRLSLDDGTTIPMAPAPLPATYAGRYRDVERVVRADVPVGRRAVSFDLLDATGALLERSAGPELAPLTERTTVTRWPGGPALEAGVRVMSQARDQAFTCVGTGLDAEGACPLVFRGMFRVVVTCAPRRLVLTAWTIASRGPLTLEGAHGIRLAARSGALPAAVGGGRGSIIVAGPKVAARRLLLRAGSRAETLTLRLPPPRSQCGYEHFGSLGASWPRASAGG